jgi:hypothetical protein
LDKHFIEKYWNLNVTISFSIATNLYHHRFIGGFKNAGSLFVRQHEYDYC